MTDPTTMGVSSTMEDIRNILQDNDISNVRDTVMGETMDLHHAVAAVEAYQQQHQQQHQQQQPLQSQQQQQQQQRQHHIQNNGNNGLHTSGNGQNSRNRAHVDHTALLEGNASPVDGGLSRLSTTPMCSEANLAQGLTATTNEPMDIETDTETVISPTDPTVATTVVSPPSICLCQQPQRIPRPRNAFILFRQHHHAQVVSANPGKANPEISKIIGEMWRESTPESKAVWQKHADDEKQKHLQRFPEYRYQPRRNGKRNLAALTGSNVGLSLSLENATCPNCGGRTGAMSAAPTPATPNFPRAFKVAPTPTANKRPQLSIPPPTPSFLKTKHDNKDQNSLSKIGTGAEALMRLHVANDSEDDPSPTSPTNHHLQRKRHKLHHIISTQQQQVSAQQLIRELQTPGLLQSHAMSEQLEGFLHAPDGVLKHHTHNHHHYDSNPAADLEQQILTFQAQGYDMTPSPATTHQPSNLLRQSTQPPASMGPMSIFDKIAAIRRVCKSLPALPSPRAQARGAVIAIEGDDKNLVNALTAALADNLKGAEKVDVLTLEESGDALPTFTDSGLDPEEQDEIRMSKLFENVAKYRRKALQIRSSVLESNRGQGLRINTGSSMAGNEDAEGETDTETVQFGLSPLDNTSPSSFHPMQTHLNPNHHLNHSNNSPSLTHLQTSHPHSQGMHLPTPTSPSSKVPILLLNRYILSLTDSISTSLPPSPSRHTFSPSPTQTSPISTLHSTSTPPATPLDEDPSPWHYALSLFRGVTAPDMIIYIETPPPSSGPTSNPTSNPSNPNTARTPINQNAELDVREDENIVVLKGWHQPSKLGGNERVVRRLGFEVSEVLRGLQGFVG